MLILPENSDSTTRRRTELCPAEWTEDFGDEFYEHVLENGFYYLAPDSEWRTTAESIPAPGMEQFAVPTSEQLQLTIENLTRGTEMPYDG